MTRFSKPEAAAPPRKTSVRSASTDLLRSSINFLHIVLMVTAAAAPLVVVSTYIPISLSSGAGLATALTYLATTLILLVFSVGFVQMAKRITAAGAFYTFASQGLGRPVGLAVGFTILAAYSMITAAIQGGFGHYASALLSNYFGLSVPWYWCSIVALASMFVISYYRVTLTARILGLLLTLEVLIVLVVDVFTIGSGGTSGQMAVAFDPAQWGAAPAVGIGFFLAFWSWIGFETTAIYGEETMDPKQSVPRATYIAVITLGVFYALAAYAAIVGFGSDSPAQAETLLDQYYFKLADMYTLPFVRTLMDFLVVSGFFACSFAFHNNAARYFFSLGRDRILPEALGRTHAKHKSPHLAAGVQAAIAITTVAIFAIGGADPILHLGTWLPIFCTLAVLVVQLLVSIAVIGYFNRVGRHSTGDYLKTLAAPIVGAVAQLVVVGLLLKNLTFLAGADSLIVTFIPVYVLAIAATGFLYAIWLRRRAPARFAAIGTLREDAVEALPDE
ncbi:amino acid/polyamine/organocation transporter (APC superfamily) [Saccharopolyspora spinosa]|uniref:Amino acid/polyamine/organocation transporter (APC superfamily) n=1 Tax=Saccharopolyspora spinosa TaxID=60894 RepID=A0A2N3Y0M7_SACSN|nr:amino acid/polyamine/organocation transporter (APC superfamily) [Saccharopolyspora spinosa]